jgi:hypothetical protein
MLKLIFKCVERKELPQDAVWLPDIVEYVMNFEIHKSKKFFSSLVTSSLHSWTTLRSLMTYCYKCVHSAHCALEMAEVIKSQSNQRNK